MYNLVVFQHVFVSLSIMLLFFYFIFVYCHHFTLSNSSFSLYISPNLHFKLSILFSHLELGKLSEIISQKAFSSSNMNTTETVIKSAQGTFFFYAYPLTSKEIVDGSTTYIIMDIRVSIFAASPLHFK